MVTCAIVGYHLITADRYRGDTAAMLTDANYMNNCDFVDRAIMAIRYKDQRRATRYQENASDGLNVIAAPHESDVDAHTDFLSAPNADDRGPVVTPSQMTCEEVARVVVGTWTIGAAYQALKSAGLSVTLAGNRISVNGSIFVQYIGRQASANSAWAIFGQDSELPIMFSTGEREL